MRWSRGFVWAAALSLGATACSAPAGPAPAPPTGTEGSVFGAGPILVSLLADGQVVAVTSEDGRLVARAVLPRPAAPAQTGQFLAVSPDGTALSVLIREADGTPDRLAVLNLPSLAVRTVVELPVGTRYQALAVGPASGRLYLVGNRADEAGRNVWLSVREAQGRPIGDALLRRGNGRTWTVYSVAVAPDERHLAVSYHGPDTTGADLVTNTGTGWSPCREPGSDGFGCLPSVHGTVLAAGDGIVATTGDGDSLVRFDYDGTATGRWNPKLPHNHLMEIVAGRQVVYALGSCIYTGGLSEVTVASGAARVVARSAPVGTVGPVAGEVCGERVVPAGGGRLAVAQLATPVAQSGPGRMLIVAAQDGTVVQTIGLAAEQLDLVAVDLPSR